MDAASVVELARGADLEVARAGVEVAERHGIVNSRYGYYRIKQADRVFRWGNFTGVGPDVEVVLACDSTPENVASEDALVRALLTSAVTWEGPPPAGAYGYVYMAPARLADFRGPSRNTKAEAVNALLDALLGEVTA